MEAEIRILLTGLAFSERDIIANAFLEKSQLYSNLETLKKVAREGDYRSELVEIANEVNKLRIRRNLFIHGIWDPHTFGKAEGHALVFDLKAKYERLGKGSERWTRGEPESFSIEEFKAIVGSIKAILERTKILRETIEEENSDIRFPSGGESNVTYLTRIFDSVDPLIDPESFD